LDVTRAKERASSPPSTRVPLPNNLGSLDELDEALQEVSAEEQKRINTLVRRLQDESLFLVTEDSADGLALETLLPDRFVGQVVRDGDRAVYASIVASKSRPESTSFPSQPPSPV
jgi:hypothetical protein